MTLFKDFLVPGKRKHFNKDLHDRFDKPARTKIKEKLGDFIQDNPNELAQDFIITSEKSHYKYLEIQVVSSWIKEKFPYEHVFVYARKGLYNNDTLFLTLNRFLTRGYIFDAKSFKEYKQPRRLKKYSREYVYDVPWKSILPVEIETLDPETVETY